MHTLFSTDCDSFLSPIAAADTLIVSNELSIFGSESELHTHHQIATEESAQRLSGSYTYHGLILGLIVLSIFTLPRILLAFNQFYRVIVGQHSIEKLYEEQSLALRFTLRLSSLLNLLLWGCILVRTCDYFGLYEILPALSATHYQLITLVAIAGVALLQSYRRVVLYSVCALTEQLPLYHHYRLLVRMLLSVGSLAIAPTFVCVSLYHGALSGALLALLFIEIAALCVTLLIKSAHFYLDRELSILQWFLYLCAVEIFPISWILLLALRH